MLAKMVDFFISGFVYPGILWTQLLLGIGLALVFGAVWFAAYWTPILKKPWAWAVLVGSALLSWVAVAFVQLPLQYWSGLVLHYFWSEDVLMSWLLLSGIPVILFSGLVQEGSKLVPVVICWLRSGRNIDPKLGLVIGAVAGLGLGVFEAVWAHNLILKSGWAIAWGWKWQFYLIALAPFWERFFVIAFHTASCALAGWGLARGWGWQFYLIVSFAHAFINYSAMLKVSGVLTTIQVGMFVAVWALIVVGGALWLRWRKTPPN